jgi:hypothetical protein
MWLGVPVAVGSAVLIVLASGLLGRRGWARWGAVVGFSLAAVAALAALLAALAVLDVGVTGNPWLNQPLPELVPTVVFLVVSVAVVVLLLVPPTAGDFSATRQAPLRDADPPQGSGTP